MHTYTSEDNHFSFFIGKILKNHLKKNYKQALNSLNNHIKYELTKIVPFFL